MTKDARQFHHAEFKNWEPNVNWGSSKWKFQGYSNMKRVVLSNHTMTIEAKENKTKTRTLGLQIIDTLHVLVMLVEQAQGSDDSKCNSGEG